jgi:hypothetical protein
MIACNKCALRANSGRRAAAYLRSFTTVTTDRMASPTNSSPRRRRLTPSFDVAKRPYDSGAETGDESDETKGLIAAGAWLRPRA